MDEDCLQDQHGTNKHNIEKMINLSSNRGNIGKTANYSVKWKQAQLGDHWHLRIVSKDGVDEDYVLIWFW